jgi:hypothetical protein
MAKQHTWRPLERATVNANVSDADVQEAMDLTGDSEADIRAALAEEGRCEFWVNDLYQVQLRRFDGEIPVVHLNIRRRDGRVIFRDWRHFQAIKNQLVGPECEGVELYPAESRLSDTSNKYHLWCIADPSFRFPFGMHGRDVINGKGGSKAGHRQRPISEPETATRL